MTTKKAIELIRKDVEHYKKLVVFVDESRSRFIKENNSDDSPPGSVRSIMRKTMHTMYEMLRSLYEDQIKYYDDILTELESKKKQRN